jgi:hypothetical protein
MISARTLVGVALALSFSSTAMAANAKGPTLRDQQQAACADDAQKLCADAMPDEAKVTACMKTKKAQVSAKCAAMYDVKQ